MPNPNGPQKPNSVFPEDQRLEPGESCWPPYGAIVGPLDLFQVIGLGLIAYSVTMMRRSAALP
jgi:hypothetical protein